MPLNTVLAADPGYDRLGLAVIARGVPKEKVLVSLCATSTKNLTVAERIAELEVQVSTLLREYKPDAIAFEKIFWSKSKKTAFGVAEVRGMLETLAGQNKLPVYQYSPQQVKLAVTGYGNSDKQAVALMVERLVDLAKRKRLDDEIDAIAVGITCLSSTRRLGI